NSDAARRRRGFEDTTAPEERTRSDFTYRRNSTLSSYRRDGPPDSERQKVHELAMQRRRMGGVFLVVILSAIGLLLLLWQLVASVEVVASSRPLNKPIQA